MSSNGFPLQCLYEGFYARLTDPNDPENAFPLNVTQRALLSINDRLVTFRSARRSGSTTALAIRALRSALLENKSVLYVGNSAMKAIDFREILQGLLQDDELQDLIQSDSVTYMSFRGGGLIRCIGRMGDNVRVAMADDILVDNAAYMDPATWDALVSILNGSDYMKTRPDCLLAGTGYLYRKDEEPPFVNLVNGNFGPGSWVHYVAPVTSDPDLNLAARLLIREMLPDAAWRTEFMCEFIEVP